MSGQRHRKHVRLWPPAWAIAGYATHTLSCISFSRKPWARAGAGHTTYILHHANAEVICHLQPGFQLVESVWNNFRQVDLWNITTFCHRQMGRYFRFLSYLCPGTSYMSGVWFDCLPFQKIRSTNERNQAQPLAATERRRIRTHIWRMVVLGMRCRSHSPTSRMETRQHENCYGHY